MDNAKRIPCDNNEGKLIENVELKIFSEILKKLNITSEEVEDLVVSLGWDNPEQENENFVQNIKKANIRTANLLIERYLLSLYYYCLIDRLKFSKLKEENYKDSNLCLEDFEYGLDKEDNMNRVDLVKLKGRFHGMDLSGIRDIPEKTIEMKSYKNTYDKVEKRTKSLKDIRFEILIDDIKNEIEHLSEDLKTENERIYFLVKKYENINSRLIEKIYKELKNEEDSEKIYANLNLIALSHQKKYIFSKKFAFDLYNFYVEDGYNATAVKKIRNGKEIKEKEIQQFKAELIELYVREGKLTKIQAEAFISKELESIPYFLRNIPRIILDKIYNYLKEKEILDEFNIELAKLSNESIKNILPQLRYELKEIEKIKDIQD